MILVECIQERGLLYTLWRLLEKGANEDERRRGPRKVQ